jgi:hypothetical protein
MTTAPAPEHRRRRGAVCPPRSAPPRRYFGQENGKAGARGAAHPGAGPAEGEGLQ